MNRNNFRHNSSPDNPVLLSQIKFDYLEDEVPWEFDEPYEAEDDYLADAQYESDSDDDYNGYRYDRWVD